MQWLYLSLTPSFIGHVCNVTSLGKYSECIRVYKWCPRTKASQHAKNTQKKQTNEAST